MLDALISAGANLIGGFLSNKGKEKEAARQKEFAQNGIQWKVEDAKKAGIAPLAALGSQPISYTPQSVGDYGVGAAGQDISRAIQSQQEPRAKLDAIGTTAARLQLENQQLQNVYLASQIRKLNQPGTGPGIAVDRAGDTIPGQPNANVLGVEVQPSQTAVVTPGVPYEQAGTNPDVMYVQTSGGGYWPIPAKHVKQQIEDMPISETAWEVRNTLLPMLATAGWGGRISPPSHVPRNWKDEWTFDPVDGYKTRRRANNNRYRDRFMRR